MEKNAEKKTSTKSKNAINVSQSHVTVSFGKGLVMILLASLLLSFQNVVTRIILKNQPSVIGIFSDVGGFLAPSFANSVLIMILRMAIVAPIMALLVAPRLYKNTWKDMKELRKPQERKRLIYAITSALFLFMSQLFIYVALGNVPTGVATTIFFIYPTFTVLFSMILFKEKPSLILVLAMIVIYIGGFLTVPAKSFSHTHIPGSDPLLGTITAVISGIAFAGYMVMIKMAKMHPAPFTIISFSIILLLGLLVMPFVISHVTVADWNGLFIGIVFLALTTLLGYLLNNSGVPIVGPAFASVISSSGPAVTVIMAFLIIHEDLVFKQDLGVTLVTLGVLGISMENLRKNKKAKLQKASNTAE
ncbi:MAG: EamA family transporter [Leptospiraceae bacterium]|nr:EamA family transporter [Leptospiraceae bacterium]